MWLITNFKKYFLTHQNTPKIFHGSHKNPSLPSPAPSSYILNVLYLKKMKEILLTEKKDGTPCIIIFPCYNIFPTFRVNGAWWKILILIQSLNQRRKNFSWVQFETGSWKLCYFGSIFIKKWKKKKKKKNRKR